MGIEVDNSGPFSPSSLSCLLPSIAQPSQEMASAIIDHILHAVRTHLGMDIAFVSEFTGTERIFRYVDAAGRSPISVGDALSMDVGYCKGVIEGTLPRLIPDTHCVPAAMAMPETTAIPIGAHLSVPIILANGRLYGTFCCFAFDPNATLNQRDLNVMEAFADLVAYQISRELEANYARDEKIARIQAAIAQGGPSIVFQPIYHLVEARCVGVESLSRFPAEYGLTPDVWFADAESVGLGTELEISAIRNALQALNSLPPELYITVNASPVTVMSDVFVALFVGVDAHRIIIEITEHAHVEDYAPLLESLANLRSLGVRVSVDDAGAGYASMRHILNLQPDIIKLDISLTRSIDRDNNRRALAAALIEFGRQIGSDVLAEGIETEEELKLLCSLGASKAQGFYLSRPLPLDEVLQHVLNND